MTTTNAYATYADFQAYMPNSTNLVQAAAESALDAVTEQFYTEVGLRFYPMIESRYFDTPDEDNELWIGNDLLEILSLTNGDTTAITSTEYKLWPYNYYPKSCIQLLPLGTTFFNQNATSWNMAAITVNAIWGYHRNYGRAWAAGTTLGAAQSSTTSTSWTVTASTAFAVGNIARVDNELILITATGTGTLTATRGWNGSTAATHDNGSAVTIWQYPADIKRAALIQAARLYRRPEAVYGTVGGGEMGVQPVAIPTLDPDVLKILAGYKDMVP